MHTAHGRTAGRGRERNRSDEDAKVGAEEAKARGATAVLLERKVLLGREPGDSSESNRLLVGLLSMSPAKSRTGRVGLPT